MTEKMNQYDYQRKLNSLLLFANQVIDLYNEKVTSISEVRAILSSLTKYPDSNLLNLAEEQLKKILIEDPKKKKAIGFKS